MISDNNIVIPKYTPKMLSQFLAVSYIRCIQKIKWFCCAVFGSGFIWAPNRFMLCTWWRHQTEPFSAFMTLCEGIHRSPIKKAIDRRFAVFFDLRLNTRLSKQARRQRVHYIATVMINIQQCSSGLLPWYYGLSMGIIVASHSCWIILKCECYMKNENK